MLGTSIFGLICNLVMGKILHSHPGGEEHGHGHGHGENNSKKEKKDKKPEGDNHDQNDLEK